MTALRKTAIIYNMEKNIKELFAEKVEKFHLPRYDELPDVGLYLEQVVKYINGCLVPIGCPELTISMVSNYVKKGVIDAPVRKLYYREQIGYLIYVSVAKNAMSIEIITQMFRMQKEAYDSVTAYDYFCSELENMLRYICGLKDTVDNIGVTNTEVKTMFRSVIISSSHIIFLNNCLGLKKSSEVGEPPAEV